MNWPQIVVIIILILELGISMAKHGEPRSSHNFIRSLFDIAATLWLLWMGGFFA